MQLGSSAIFNDWWSTLKLYSHDSLWFTDAKVSILKIHLRTLSYIFKAPIKTFSMQIFVYIYLCPACSLRWVYATGYRVTGFFWKYWEINLCIPGDKLSKYTWPYHAQYHTCAAKKYLFFVINIYLILSDVFKVKQCIKLCKYSCNTLIIYSYIPAYLEIIWFHRTMQLE